MTVTANTTSLTGELGVLIIVRKCQFECDILAGGLARQARFETIDHQTLPEYEFESLCFAAFKRLAVDFSAKVDGHLVTVLTRALDGLEYFVLATQGFDHLVDIGVGYLTCRTLDLELLNRLQGNFRIDLERRGKREPLARRRQ